MTNGDKFDTMALIAGPIAGLKSEQLPGLAHIFRQIAADEREACAKFVVDSFEYDQAPAKIWAEQVAKLLRERADT